jgi:peroxiredoxin
VSARLEVGDPVPWIALRQFGGSAFSLALAAGRPSVITHVGSSRAPGADVVIAGLRGLERFDGEHALLVIATADPKDEREARLHTEPPSRLVLRDFDLSLGKALGILVDLPGRDRPTLKATSFVLDAGMRVVSVVPVRDPGAHAAEVAAALDRISPVAATPGGEPFAPVLVIPSVLERELCAMLVSYYDAGTPELSGVAVHQPDGSGSIEVDGYRKRRRDLTLVEGPLLDGVHDRVRRRVAPVVERAFRFRAAYAERYVVAAYEARDRGWFAPHRDNGGPSTEHRQFACSLNLDAATYQGGDLWFPEFGGRRYRPPSGGALVFSCSLLHAVDPVTQGRRLTVLPFLFDAAGAVLRARNHGDRAPPAHPV